MKHLLMILTLIALTACGGGYSSGSSKDYVPVNEQTPQEEAVKDFSTRINNTLLIAGRKCEGSETTRDANGGTVSCQKNQWLVTVDNANTCTPGGVCTEIGVVPFVAQLDRSDRVEPPKFTFFKITPVSAVTPAQTNTLNNYLVRFDLNSSQAEVVAK